VCGLFYMTVPSEQIILSTLKSYIMSTLLQMFQNKLFGTKWERRGCYRDRGWGREDGEGRMGMGGWGWGGGEGRMGNGDGDGDGEGRMGMGKGRGREDGMGKGRGREGEGRMGW